MVGTITTFVMILVLVSSGCILEAVKRLLMLITQVLLKVLSFFGIHVRYIANRLHMPRSFRRQHKEIHIVKKSIENVKLESSVDVFALSVLVLCICVVVYNIVSGGQLVNMIWKWSLIQMVFSSSRSFEVAFTAVLFSILSFSASKCLEHWKKTKPYRIAKKQLKQRQQLLYTMSSKELLDTLKQKDTELYEKLKAERKDD